MEASWVFVNEDEVQDQNATAKRKSSVENDMKSVKIFAEEKRVLNRNRNSENLQLQINNDGTENSVQRESENPILVAGVNPAVQFLKSFRKEMQFEALPHKIENFMKAYKNFDQITTNKKTYKVNNQLFDLTVKETVKELDDLVAEKLYKLRNGKLKRAWTWVTNYFNPEVTINNAAQVNKPPPLLYDPTSTMANSTSVAQAGTFSFYNGKSPTTFNLVTTIASRINFMLKDFLPVMEASDKLDRSLFELIGLRLYSEAFSQLIEKLNFAYRNLDKDFDHISSSHQENLRVLIQDQVLLDNLKSLSSVLNDEFYRKVAFAYISKILEKFPQDCSKVMEEMYLDFLQKAIQLLIIIKANETDKTHSLNIKEGIIDMEDIICKMTLLEPTSSSDY